MSSTTMQHTYFFGPDAADGDASQRELLGGKGANLAEMCRLALPVPPGFTLTTEVCNEFTQRDGHFPDGLLEEVRSSLDRVEVVMDRRFGDPERPLLLSVRSGARQSMPGMMETILDLGLTRATIPGLIAMTDDERFAWDAYRRLLEMYADVVLEKSAGREPGPDGPIRDQLEEILAIERRAAGAASDLDLSAADLERICGRFEERIASVLGTQVPDDPMEQLLGAIGAVFRSWNGKRAIAYRKLEGIPDEWGTAANVQAMVFGNLAEQSGTGVAFTRNPATGENRLYGEWLPRSQGEDVVSGSRTPWAIDRMGQTAVNRELPTLEETMPEVYQELLTIKDRLENRFLDLQDLEFTIEKGRLWMLQTRTGKRNGPAAVRVAVEMVREGAIDSQEAVRRVTSEQIREVLHPRIPETEAPTHTALARGLPAGPGGATGRIALTPEKAQEMAAEGLDVILARIETSAEDVHGMHAAKAIVTARGGMTSHAALVARGWGKTCVVGCDELEIDVRGRTITVGETILREGDEMSVDGTRGLIWAGLKPLEVPNPDGDENLTALLEWSDEIARLSVRANADRPEDADRARRFGAKGIGLCRTEHMFFGDERIRAMRRMIVARKPAERTQALEDLLPLQRKDFEEILEVMAGYPVVIRLLDPPLHEFVPRETEQIELLAQDLGLPVEEIESRLEQLEESNPMLGHRGCRLGITHPEITRMQAKAVAQALVALEERGVDGRPEIMVPLVGTETELKNQREVVIEAIREVNPGLHIPVGTMIEVPRAAIAAERIAHQADFFSFGTNDLTQTTCAFSRDDAATFLPTFLELGVYEEDPFATIDQKGVGALVELGIRNGRRGKADLEIGVCGEHGGDPKSIHFFHKLGLDYVSASPWRVPVARHAAARAVLAQS